VVGQRELSQSGARAGDGVAGSWLQGQGLSEESSSRVPQSVASGVQVAGLITALTFWARRLVSSAYDGTVQQAQWGLASGTGPRSGRYLHWQRIVVLSRGREGRCFSNNQERPRSDFEANAGQRIGPASPQAGARLSTNGGGPKSRWEGKRLQARLDRRGASSSWQIEGRQSMPAAVFRSAAGREGFSDVRALRGLPLEHRRQRSTPLRSR
jgi:hypothetical protein